MSAMMCAGLVPLLPKPTTSSHLNTFTFVPVPRVTHQYANLRVVAAEPAEVKLCTYPPSLQGDN